MHSERLTLQPASRISEGLIFVVVEQRPIHCIDYCCMDFLDKHKHTWFATVKGTCM